MTDPFDTTNTLDLARVSTMAGGLEPQLDAPELAAENHRLRECVKMLREALVEAAYGRFYTARIKEILSFSKEFAS